MQSTNASRIARTLSIASFFALVCWPGVAAALTFVVNGIEFSDPIFVDVADGSDLILETTEDIYVFAPNGLTADPLSLVAAGALFIENVEPFGDGAPPTCTPDCPSEILDFTSDVVVQILAPLGDTELRAGGSMIITGLPIPEPGTGALMGLGLIVLGLGQRGRSRPTR